MTTRPYVIAVAFGFVLAVVVVRDLGSRGVLLPLTLWEAATVVGWLVAIDEGARYLWRNRRHAKQRTAP